MKIGKRLVSLLKSRNITQAQLASMIDIESQSFISAICNDKKLPSLEVLFAICDALNISVSDFFKPLSNPDALVSPCLDSIIGRLSRLSSSQVKLLDAVASNFEIESVSSATDYAALPLLGGAAAGVPLNNEAFPGESILVPTKYADSTRYYGISATGKSMEPKIHDGDYVVVHYDSSPEINDIVLIRSDDIADVGYAIKKLSKKGICYKFSSFNPDYPPLEIQHSDIISLEKVVHIIHK